jgi:hypothetical protein
MNTFNQTTSSHPMSNTNIFNQRINTEEMFEYAIEQANAGKQNQALDIAREALIKAKQNNLYIALYIHSFMAVLYLDQNNIGNARIHIYNAMNKLSKLHFSYNTDKLYLDTLLALVNKSDKTIKQLQIEAFAA